MLKLMSTDFIGRFWNIIIFVFLGLTFSIHVLQYEERVFKQFCNPVLDLDRMIKSSAYNSEFICSNSCLFSRHSRSNHFLLDVILIRLRDLLVLILRQIFYVTVRMFTASFNETFTFSVFRSINSLIRIWIGSVRNAFLSFK